MRDIAPDQFHRSQYFHDYYHQTTMVDEIGFVSYPEKETTLTICLGRDASNPSPFCGRTRDLADRIAPIVAALIDRNWKETQQDRRPSLVTEADGREAQDRILCRALADIHGIRLSKRQVQVALLILRGHSSTSIGLRLGVSPQTVKVFRRQIYIKCSISSQGELFALLLPILTNCTPRSLSE